MTEAWLVSDKSTPRPKPASRRGIRVGARVQRVSSDAFLPGPRLSCRPCSASEPGWSQGGFGEPRQGSPADAPFQQAALGSWAAVSVWNQSIGLFRLHLPCLWVTTGRDIFPGRRPAKASPGPITAAVPPKPHPRSLWFCSFILRWMLVSQDGCNQASHTRQLKRAEKCPLALWRPGF